MGKFARLTLGRRPATSPVVTTAALPDVVTYESAPGWSRDAKSDLFLLAVTNLVSEDTFYESAGDRDARFCDLVAEVTVTDPGWVARLVPFLRDEVHLRSASVMLAAEYALALRGAPGAVRATAPTVRRVVASALRRADEPGEFVAYWILRTGRRTLPGGVQRGVADAVTRLFDERAVLRYDGIGRAMRLGDVLELTHPTPRAEWQGDLFAYLLDRRHHPDAVRAPLDRLPVIRARRELEALDRDAARTWLLADPARPAAAGLSWEALSGFGPMDAAAWTAVIPSMGYLALLRNLRNFDQAGVPDDVAEGVARRLGDPAQVARSRQLPFRFLSAYRAAPSLRWGHALERALTASMANVPALRGRTLVLVDTSSSMSVRLSGRGTLFRWDAAATFGVALAQRCESADVVSFSAAPGRWGRVEPRTRAFPLTAGEPLLRSLDRWQREGYYLSGGTHTPGAVRRHFAGHDRVVIVTDEQVSASGDTVSAAVPADVPLYTWNLAGHAPAHGPSGQENRHTFGGLSDAAFRLVPLLEAGRSAHWPF